MDLINNSLFPGQGLVPEQTDEMEENQKWPRKANYRVSVTIKKNIFRIYVYVYNTMKSNKTNA